MEIVRIHAIESESWLHMVENTDNLRRDIQRIASSLEEIAECLKNNNQ